MVRDVGSLNGTYVNRERIEEAELTAVRQIGKFVLLLASVSADPIRERRPSGRGELR